MLLHIGCFGDWRDHGLLFHADMASSMRRIISARLLWFVRAPGLDFIVDRLMSSISATTTTTGQTPAAESDEQSNKQSTNDGAHNGHN